MVKEIIRLKYGTIMLEEKFHSVITNNLVMFKKCLIGFRVGELKMLIWHVV
jgi:hypothetical protein